MTDRDLETKLVGQPLYVTALEADCDAYNADLPVLRSFVLPGGSHGLITTRQGLDTELADATRFAPGYLTAIRAWVAAHITFPR